MERFEVFSLGKHYLHIHTEKGFTLYANAKLVNGQLTSYTDKMVRNGGSWVIDVWRFLNKKDFPINPIYTAVFGFDSEDTAVSVTGTDINVDSISGVNGQLVDVGNISLPENQALRVSTYGGVGNEIIRLGYDVRAYKRYLDDDTKALLHEKFGSRFPSVLNFYGVIKAENFLYDGKSGKFVTINLSTGVRTVYDVCLKITNALLTDIEYPFSIESLSEQQLDSQYSQSLTYRMLHKNSFCEVYDNGKVYILIF